MLGSGRSVIFVVVRFFWECYLIIKGLCSLFTSCILCCSPSHNSWPSCGESQHWQDSIFPGWAVLCSEIWKMVFWVWGGNWRRHARWLGQARLSAWHWAGGRWPSLCVWRQQGKFWWCPHIPSPSFSAPNISLEIGSTECLDLWLQSESSAPLANLGHWVTKS